MEIAVAICFLSTGLTGFTIFKQTRPSFYSDRSEGWLFFVTFVYIFLGPAILIFSIPTLLNPEN